MEAREIKKLTTSSAVCLRANKVLFRERLRAQYLIQIILNERKRSMLLSLVLQLEWVDV